MPDKHPYGYGQSRSHMTEAQAAYVRESLERIRKIRERKIREMQNKKASDRRARLGLPAEEVDPHFDDSPAAMRKAAAEAARSDRQRALRPSRYLDMHRRGGR